MKEYERLTVIHPSGAICITETKQLPNTRESKMVLERLAKLEDDLESGKMIRLPCSVGDTVWRIVTFIDRTENIIISKHIQEYQVEKIVMDSNNLYLVILVSTEDGICEGYARPNQVYYTKAEAEKKLKELQGK